MGIFKMKCTKCGQVVTSPPLGNDCPKGGQHSWTQAILMIEYIRQKRI
jgi:uncharacterized OB-fold protein